MRVLLFLMLLWPLAAGAGPWPRDAGEHFLSASVTGDTAALWFERGFSRGRWVVAEARLDRDGAWAGALRFNKALRDRGRWRLAWSLGVSVGMPQSDIVIDLPPVWWPGRTEVIVKIRPRAALQAGISLGTGLERPWPGWAALDLMAEAGPATRVLRAEATLGLRPGARWMVMVQGHATLGDGPPALALAPSVVWQMRPGVQLQSGVHHDLRGRRTGVKLASWFRF